MQVTKVNNNNTSFGINAVRFLSEEAQSNFDRMARNMNFNQKFFLLEEIKNIKPKSGPDVDVFVGNGARFSRPNDVFLSAQSKVNQQEGIRILDSAKNDAVFTGDLEDLKGTLSRKQIIQAFKNLIADVDSSRASKRKPVYFDTFKES